MMESKDGEMTQTQFNELFSELQNLIMMQGIEYDEKQEKRIKEIEEELGLES